MSHREVVGPPADANAPSSAGPGLPRVADATDGRFGADARPCAREHGAVIDSDADNIVALAPMPGSGRDSATAPAEGTFVPLAPMRDPANPWSPSQMEVLENPAGLARSAGRSAAVISESVAALGLDPSRDAELLRAIWAETMAQIERVQRLHGLPKMQFQIEGPPGSPPWHDAGTRAK